MKKKVNEQDLIDILRELLTHDPIMGDDRMNEFCFYCDAFNTPTHDPDCLYLRVEQTVEQYDQQAAEVVSGK